MTVALVTVVFYTYPLLTALGSAALGRERITPRRMLALAVAGAGLLSSSGDQVGPSAQASVAGIALAFLAALGHASYLIIVKGGFDRVPPAQGTACVLSGGFVISGTAALVLYGSAVARTVGDVPDRVGGDPLHRVVRRRLPQDVGHERRAGRGRDADVDPHARGARIGGRRGGDRAGPAGHGAGRRRRCARPPRRACSSRSATRAPCPIPRSRRTLSRSSRRADRPRRLRPLATMDGRRRGGRHRHRPCAGAAGPRGDQGCVSSTGARSTPGSVPSWSAATRSSWGAPGSGSSRRRRSAAASTSSWRTTPGPSGWPATDRSPGTSRTATRTR